MIERDIKKVLRNLLVNQICWIKRVYVRVILQK